MYGIKRDDHLYDLVCTDSYKMIDFIISEIWRYMKKQFILMCSVQKGTSNSENNYFMGEGVGDISRSISFLKIKLYEFFYTIWFL